MNKKEVDNEMGDIMLRKSFYYFKWMIIVYIILGIIAQFFNALGIVYLQKILDKLEFSPIFDDLLFEIIIYGLLLCGASLVSYIIEYPTSFLSHSLSERLKVMALKKISKIDYSSYQEMGTGEVVKIIENGAEAGKNIIFSYYLRIFHELLPTIIFSLLFISFYDYRIMLVIAIGYIVIFIITNILLKFLYSLKNSLLQEQEDSSRFSIRGFMELVVFRTSKRYEKEINRLEGIADNIVNKSTKIRMIHEAFFGIFAILISIIKIVVIIVGTISILQGDTTVGILVALLMFIDRIYNPVAIFNVLYVDFKLNRLTYDRFQKFINAPEDKNLDEGLEIPNIEGNIELKNVSFSYGDVNVLKDISLSINSGDSVALVGLSGGGKSTLVKLIIGLLKKEKGKILWDGIDIDKINLNSLYEFITYIAQEAPIFDDTIRGNIVFDSNEISDQKIYDILEKVHLKDKVLNLPEKLETRVGERGLKLSGGERQRLAFARAIAQNKNVVILDEPVSALDNIVEKSLMNQIIEINKDNTMIIIAHRLNFVKSIDKIVVMRDGKIIDQGDFNYLIKNCEYFRELWEKQQFEEEYPQLGSTSSQI